MKNLINKINFALIGSVIITIISWIVFIGILIFCIKQII